MRIYLVEDAENLRKQIAEALCRIPGIELAGVASSAGDAIAGVHASSPDLVVLDLGLRSGAGQDVLRGLQACGHRVRVVVFSNTVDSVTVNRCLQLGAMAVLDKSNQIDQLYELIENLSREMC